jgi:methyl-accepting chemotaxis protein
MIVLVAVGGVFSLTGLGAVQKNVVNMATNWVPSVNLVNAINTNTADLRIAEASHIMSTTPEEMNKAEADFNAAMADMKKNQENYERLISSDEERKTYNSFKEKFAEYMALHDKLITISRANQNAQAAVFFKGDMKNTYDEFSNLLYKDVQINITGAGTDYKSSNKQYSIVQFTTLSVLGVSLLIGFVAVIVIINNVVKPIRRTTEVMAAISKGQLDTDIPYGTVQNEIGDMARTLAQIIHRNAVLRLV